MRTKPMQLTVMAVAALAIVAVAAVMLLAGGNPAQATTAATIAPDSGGGHLLPMAGDKDPTPTPTPRFPQPERCSALPAEVVSSGHIALFDVYWNPGEKELTNTSCPPTVVYVPAGEDDEGNPIPARYERTGSNINIEETVVHVPNDAKVDLSKSDTPYTQAKYPAVWTADNKEDRDTDGDGDGVGDRKVWVLKPGNDWLTIGFSADLLNPADWGNSDEEGSVSGDRTVQYEFDHVHQLDIGEQGRRYALTYNVPADGAAGPFTPIWDTSNSDRNETQITPGEYEHPIWFFTRAGRYEFQVHVKGHPDLERTDGVPPVSVDTAVTSDVRNYTFHVGLMADLSLTTVGPRETAVGERSTITITASNAGPDTATSTKVDVNLPDGLTYDSHEPSADTFADSDGDGTWTWDVGNLANGASETLTLKVIPAAGTHGQELKVSAEIYATEHIASRDVVELDPNTANNMPMTTISVTPEPNVNPIFAVMGSVDENSVGGTKVIGPIKVKEPNVSDTVTLGLTGDGNGHFYAEQDENRHIYIFVAQGAQIDYETKSNYDLVLTISDGKDLSGNIDASVDDSLAVSIQINDVDEAFTATLTSSATSVRVGEPVTLTLTLANPPVSRGELNWRLEETHNRVSTSRSGTNPPQSWTVTKNDAGRYLFKIKVWSGNVEAWTSAVEVHWNIR